MDRHWSSDKTARFKIDAMQNRKLLKPRKTHRPFLGSIAPLISSKFVKGMIEHATRRSDIAKLAISVESGFRFRVFENKIVANSRELRMKAEIFMARVHIVADIFPVMLQF